MAADSINAWWLLDLELLEAEGEEAKTVGEGGSRFGIGEGAGEGSGENSSDNDEGGGGGGGGSGRNGSDGMLLSSGSNLRLLMRFALAVLLNKIKQLLSW